jgi:hypothetical protein
MPWLWIGYWEYCETKNFCRRGAQDPTTAFPESPTSLQTCSVHNLRIERNKTVPTYLQKQYRIREGKLTKFDKKFSVALPLVGREGENTGDVVVFRWLLLLTKVAYQVKTPIVQVCHYVEEERIRIIIPASIGNLILAKAMTRNNWIGPIYSSSTYKVLWSRNSLARRQRFWAYNLFFLPSISNTEILSFL